MRVYFTHMKNLIQMLLICSNYVKITIIILLDFSCPEHLLVNFILRYQI